MNLSLCCLRATSRGLDTAEVHQEKSSIYRETCAAAVDFSRIAR